MRVDRTRRSAKQVLKDAVDELLRRPACHDTNVKLEMLQTIASRMSWMDIFNRIQYRHRSEAKTDVPVAAQRAHWYQD